MNNNKPNPVVHFEMPYEDRDRAGKFYAEAFGWGNQKYGPEMQNYMVMMTQEMDANNMPKEKGMINGGMYQKPNDPSGQYPSFVIAVEDMAAAIERIKAAGGKNVSEPMDIPGVGAYATFVDTEGNRLSIMKPIKM